MNEQAIQDFLTTTAMSWQQTGTAFTAGRGQAEGQAEGQHLPRTRVVLASRRSCRSRAVPAGIATVSSESHGVAAPELRPGIRLNFHLMRQARVVPRRKGDPGNLVDLRIGERIVRVRLDTHEVVSVT